jgi:hypothetical protein
MSEGVALMNERDLVCTGCGRTVQVYEVPVRWIDPTRYRCGPCQKSGPRTRLPRPPSEREFRNSREGHGGAVADAIAVHGQDNDFKRQPGHGQPYDPRTAQIPF